MTIQMIELSKLVVSAQNVRTTMPSKEADKRLMASIASLGVLQNLVVVPEGEGTFGVVAGGRRLRALKALESAKKIPTDTVVACRVRDEKDGITEISLAENVSQETMHPADQFEAFSKLEEQGATVTDIATAFGVTKKLVKQRMRLGRVAPVVLAAYKRGHIDLDVVMAFAATPDQERQIACFKSFEGGHISEWRVRQYIAGTSLELRCGAGRFVGRAAYIKNGGVLDEDLFSEAVYLRDTALVERLAMEKLERAAKKLRKEEPEWLWIEPQLNLNDSPDIHTLGSDYIDVPDALQAELDAAQSQYDVLMDCYFEGGKLIGGDDSTEDYTTEEQLDDAFSQADERLDALLVKKDDHLGFTAEQKAYAGCYVSICSRGELKVVKGLVRDKDLPAEQGEPNVAPETSEDAPIEKAGISKALASDLAMYRQQAAKAALLADPALASDLVHFNLCVSILGGGWGARAILDASSRTVPSITGLDDNTVGLAVDEMEAVLGELPLAWKDLSNSSEQFAEFRSLPRKTKEKLVAFCAAQSLQINLLRGESPIQDAVVDYLAVDFAKYWRPTKANYFGRLNKRQMLEKFTPIFGQEWAESGETKKKGDLASELEFSFIEAEKEAGHVLNSWVPPEF